MCLEPGGGLHRGLVPRQIVLFGRANALCFVPDAFLEAGPDAPRDSAVLEPALCCYFSCTAKLYGVMRQAIHPGCHLAAMSDGGSWEGSMSILQLCGICQPSWFADGKFLVC